MALFRAIHEQCMKFTAIDTFVEVAESAGLDTVQFRESMADRSLLSKLAEDHIFAIETLGVFGTPTLVFPHRQAVFVKMSLPPPEDSFTVFDELLNLIDRRRYIQEVKRSSLPLRTTC